ncbi:MAG: DUF1361 domain-containing protein [Phaeodactylibacter sp.]|nr:DUF1361 domain-containing protein [Phaeodactylibacter sp.]MCB9273793.1 DUF1361 domain-containing protein [Lewinellaceae bacterium]
MKTHPSRLTRLLLLQSAAACCLVLLRALFAGSDNWGQVGVAQFTSLHVPPYAYLPWNLLLAWAPYALSWLLRPGPGFGPANWAVLMLWLLFFPNAPYIITDFIHLRPRPPIPLWYDALMLFNFAWAGLLLGFFSLLEVQRHIERQWGRKSAQTVVAAIIILGSFGVYMGRFLRWNSWDALLRPIAVMKSLSAVAEAPMPALGPIALFTVFLGIGYATFFHLSRKEVS